MLRTCFLLVVCHLLNVAQSFGQEPWQSFTTTSHASLRGLAAVSKDVVWACGSQGTIVRTLDGGSHWNRISIPQLDKLDKLEFRSIHAWDGDRAIVATAGQPAVIMKTLDGGISWLKVYENLSPQAFFDGMRFFNDQSGLAFSDPVDGCLLIVKSLDGGNSWSVIPPSAIPKMDVGEAGFAASNSTLFVSDNNAWIGLGGGDAGSSRIFRSSDRGESWTFERVNPILRGESAGIFSVAFDGESKGVCVGGDYRKESTAEHNIALSDDGGLSWRSPKNSRPRGFRSSVVSAFVRAQSATTESRIWLACGPAGCDWSSDRESWQALSETGFHALSVSSDNVVWAAGSNGRVAKFLGLSDLR